MWILAINTATDALGVGVVQWEEGSCGTTVETLIALRRGPGVASARNAGTEAGATHPKVGPRAWNRPSASPTHRRAREAGPSACEGSDRPPVPAMNHSETLMPAVAWVCERAGIGPADLGGVAVVAGPGGFTGVRTGLAAAKAISQSRGIPIRGVDTLEALAAGHAAEGLVSPLLDARRGDVFAALYRREGASGLALLEAPVLTSLEAWVGSHAAQPIVFLGEGAERHPEILPSLAAPECHVIRPATVARLAAPHLLAGGDDPVSLVPRYHRTPVMAPDWRPAGMTP